MKHRKLRIAWSVVWSAVVLVLIVLWVRSYWCNEGITIRQPSISYFGVFSTTACSGIGSNRGQVCVMANGSWGLLTPSAWVYANQKASKEVVIPATLGFAFSRSSWTGNGLVVPHWFLALLSAIIGAASWLPYSPRFTARTLLIATTLVAVGLGMIVWAAK